MNTVIGKHIDIIPNSKAYKRQTYREKTYLSESTILNTMVNPTLGENQFHKVCFTSGI